MSKSLDVKKNKLYKIITPLFIISAFLTAIFAIISMIFPAKLTEVLVKIQQFFAVNYGWFIMILPITFVIICFYFGCSKKYGHLRLGGQDSKPEFSTFTWLAMLFTAGIGIGIVFFGINEPIYAYFLSPIGINGDVSQIEAARNSMGIALFHWGIAAWAVFSISGLVMGYFVYKHKTKYLPGEPIAKTFAHKKWAKPLAQITNVLAIVCAALTIATTIGLGVIQIAGGSNILFNFSEDVQKYIPFVFLIILFIIFAKASTKPLQKGMKVIGNINMIMAIALMVFVMVFGPTRYIFEQIVSTFGVFIDWLIPQNFQMYMFAEESKYVYEWPIVSWLWWISWTPFMGVFIASISKGRTVREFSFATMTVPVAFMILWLATFGGSALLNVIQGNGAIADIALNNPDMTFFTLLQQLPFYKITIAFTLILLIFFLATTCTSAAVSLSTMTDVNGKENNPIRAVVWSVLMTMVAVAAIFASFKGGNEALNGIKALATTMTIPYLLFFLLTISAFIKQIISDNKGKEEEK